MFGLSEIQYKTSDIAISTWKIKCQSVNVNIDVFFFCCMKKAVCGGLAWKTRTWKASGSGLEQERKQLLQVGSITTANIVKVAFKQTHCKLESTVYTFANDKRRTNSHCSRSLISTVWWPCMLYALNERSVVDLINWNIAWLF